jgi:hypothetical protein
MSLPNIPDEYGIARCLCTGHPHPRQTHECSVCGADAQCYGDKGGYKCFSCAREEYDALSDTEAVELLGFGVIDDA